MARPTADMTPPTTARRAFAVMAWATIALLGAGCLPPSGRGASQAPGGSDGGVLASSAATPGQPTPRPSIVRPTPTPAPTFAVHTVATNDNLNSIARRYGTSPRSIAFWNRATYPSLDPDSSAYRPNVLKVGWKLNIIPNVILTDDEAPPLASQPGPS